VTVALFIYIYMPMPTLRANGHGRLKPEELFLESRHSKSILTLKVFSHSNSTLQVLGHPSSVDFALLRCFIVLLGWQIRIGDQDEKTGWRRKAREWIELYDFPPGPIA